MPDRLMEHPPSLVKSRTGITGLDEITGGGLPTGRPTVVSVRDNGIGLPADKLSSIFEMFSQVEDALSRSQGGLGIGLSLVKQLVQMHGGAVEARSAGRNQGSEFIVRLPI